MAMDERDGGSVDDSRMDSAQRKRFYILSAVVIVVASLVTGLAVMLSTQRKEPVIDSSIQLSSEDRADADRVVRGFLNRAGSWGLREDAVNAGNLRQVSYTVQQNTQTADKYFLSRNAAYNGLKLEFLSPDGDLWYDSSRTAKWWDSISREALASFETTSVTPTIPEKGSVMVNTENGDADDDDQRDSMIVQVRYSVRERKFSRTATDSSWDGTYAVLVKVFQETAQIVLVRGPEGWRVQKMTGNDNPFLLCTWSDPDTDYNDTQFGFTQERTVKTTLEKVK